jgi:STE24 endopeptidase
MQALTLLFLFALAAGVLLELWLYRRHSRHVSGNREQVPTAFAASVTLEEHRKAADYTLTKVRMGEFELIFGAALLLFWTLGGGVDFVLRAWAGSGTDWPLLTGVAAILSVFFLQGLIEQPLALWRTFRIEQRFGFNRTTPVRYIKDLLLASLLGLLLGGPLLLALLWLMSRAGTYWWLYAWVLWMAFSLFVTWAYPTFIAPLFNTFTPLAEGPLKARIAALLARCGFQARGIFVMDGSTRSAHGNAYFTGLGRSKRIVFFDTLMKNLGEEEMEAVLAHELGHFKRRHVQKNLALSSALSLLGFALLGWLSQDGGFYQAFGVAQPSPAAALLLFILVVPVFGQFLTPLGAWLMRRYEYEADDYAVQQASGQALINALVKLYQDNASTLTPDPLFSAFHDSHPPAPVRIAHISTRMAETHTGRA